MDAAQRPAPASDQQAAGPGAAGPQPFRVPFAKGHGTENDFVLLHDPDGELDLSAGRVAALCDRRAGVGGDGLIRVVRAKAVDEGRDLPDDTWFMDYRNGDGSPAQMCGNGIRVFVAYLERLGLVGLADGDRLLVGTRAGVKAVRRDGDGYAADLGPWHVVGGEQAARDGYDVRFELAGADVPLAGLSVDVGNPHVVVAVPSVEQLRGLDLRRSPQVHPAPPDGTNVEVVVPQHNARLGTGELVMRVHERGVGETRSCGTGAVAAVLAARVWGGPQAPDVWTVTVPGGRLTVRVPAGSGTSGDGVELSGPARIVATGTLENCPDA
jgi:diaminopimelate epimerase